MDATTIIRRPLITEKVTFQSNDQNRYAFEVDRRATKPQIKTAIEALYDVRVLSVATQNRKGQLRSSRYGFWRSRDMKRAIVKVHPDDRIELF